MSKRSLLPADDDHLGDNASNNSKKIKLNNNNKLLETNLLNLQDEFSHLISFLKIGEVIMLSLSCKSIHNLIKEHLQTIHPYTVSTEYSKEWSISNALKTQRRLIVNDRSIAELNVIFDTMIDKKESLEKLTKLVEMNDNDTFDLDSVCELISKPTGQSKEHVKMAKILVKKDEASDEDDEDDEEEEEEQLREKFRADLPISQKKLKSIPIGFQIKELIVEVCDVSVPDVYRILSHCHSLEKFIIYLNNDDDDDNEKDFSIQIPIFENLKFLEVEITCFGDHSTKMIYDLVKLAPNLEFLDLTCFKEFDDEFLTFLTQKCPKLRGISLHQEEQEEDLKFTDEGILNFLKGEPKLEYLNFATNCCNISGEICSKLGQFKNLRSININVSHNPEAVLYDDIHFGGGVLDKLEFISFGNGFSIEESEKKTKLIQSLIEMAPNIKEIDTLLADLADFNLLDFSAQLSPLLTVFPNQYTSSLENHNQVAEWLKNSKGLESIEWGFNVDISKLEPIPSLKKISFLENTDLRIVGKELSRVFPSVTSLVVDKAENFVEMVRDGRFPELKLYNNLSMTTFKQIVDVRPNIYGLYDNDLLEFVESCKIPDATLQFVKEWLILDDVVQYHKVSSPMFKFFNFPKYLRLESIN